MLAKVKAALDARRDPDLFIAARTDAAGVEGLDAAIARCQLFMEAGADMAKPMGFDTIEDIKRALREIRRPAHGDAVAGRGPQGAQPRGAGSGRRGRRDLSLGRAVRRGQCGAQRAAPAQARQFARPASDHLLPLDDYYDLVGLKAMLAREESYDKAAAALVQKRAAE